MNSAEREFFVSRICSGYIKCEVDGYIFKIHPPSPDVLYDASELAKDIHDKDDGLSEDDIMFFLVEHDLWNMEKENRWKELPEKIDDIKVDMFEAKFRSNTREKLRKELGALNKEYTTLNSERNIYFGLSTEGISILAKSYYLIENSTYLDGKLYDWLDVSVSSVISKYNSLLLSDKEMRELARTDPWHSMWTIKKQNGKIFDEPMSYEQRQIILYSKFYDSINDSPEKPPQDVIDDDDLLDGWLINNKRTRATETEDDFTTNPKIANADEVFIIAETDKDIKKINNMNATYGKVIKDKRFRTLTDKKEMSWMEFADMKQNLRIEATKHLRANLK